MADSHAGWNGVWVDDQVGTDTLLSERHVFLAVGHTDCTLLAVPRSKLVANLWNTDRSHFDLGEPVAIFIRGQYHLVDHAYL